jgi:hypothetical protein
LDPIGYISRPHNYEKMSKETLGRETGKRQK